jgi:hypothetical protein
VLLKCQTTIVQQIARFSRIEMRDSLKTVIKTGLVLAALILVACLAPGANAQVHGDGQIVRNERIGPFRLGSTAVDIIAVFGQPGRSWFFGDEGYLTWYDGLGTEPNNVVLFATTVGPRMEVFMLSVGPAARGYVTPEGVTVGMSELDVRLRLGNPTQRVWDDGLRMWWIFYPGMVLFTPFDGPVTQIDICERRYQHSGRGRGRWCY